MNIVDVLILIILLISTAISLYRGFIVEALSLFTWTIALTVASTLYLSLSYLMKDLIRTDFVRQPLAWLALLAVTVVVLHFLAALFQSWIAQSQLSVLDRLLACVFGFLRGALLVALTVWLFSNAFSSWYVQQDWRRDSILLPYIEPIAEWPSVVILKVNQALEHQPAR